MSNQKKAYVETYGCPSNKFDLGIILAQLDKMGYTIADLPKFADLLIVNTCGVKKPTEDRILARLQMLMKLDKPLIISGCLPKINLQAILRVAPQFSAIVDPFSVDQITTAVTKIETGERHQIYFSDKPKIKAEMPRRRISNIIGIFQISEGCLGSCTFCCTRFARGTLSSYPLKSIVMQIRNAIKDGVKEIWLTSQDTGVYGLDKDHSLAELLRKICQIDGFFRVRVGMMNPIHLRKKIDDLIEAFQHEKVFKFIHLPLPRAWWAETDSNRRRPKPPGLQPGAIVHSAIRPYLRLFNK